MCSGLNGRLPDDHVAAAVFSGATIDTFEVLLRTRAKAAAGGEHNGDEKEGHFPHRAQQ